MRRFVVCTVVAILAIVPSLRAQATLASLDGTYTFLVSNLGDYSPEYNWTGQQVGFCNGLEPVGYNCGYNITFGLITGTIVADGKGNITSGTFTQANDPNSYECNPKDNPTTPCPVKVPSDNPYSSTEAYKVGAVVDFTVGSTTRTYQAVRANTGKPPNWTATADNPYICTYNNMNTCDWDQLPSSQTNGDGAGTTGTFTGTYTINPNGSGVMTVTLKATDCTGGNCTETSKFAIVVSPTSTVGQSVHVSGESVLGNHNKCVGGATRIK